jgi:hypothetical protein
MCTLFLPEIRSEQVTGMFLHPLLSSDCNIVIYKLLQLLQLQL